MTAESGAACAAGSARAVGAALLLAILANSLVASALGQIVDWRSAIYLALWIHILVSLYDGSFDRTRKVTWVALIGTWFAIETLACVAGLRALGQIGFAIYAWTGSKAFPEPMLPSLGDALKPLASSATALDPIACLLTAMLPMDCLAMHLQGRIAGARRFGTSLATVAAALVIGGASGFITRPASVGEDEAASFFSIPAPYFAESYYAVKQLIPIKEIGIVLVACLFLVPLAWPWLRVDRVRTGPMSAVFALAAAVFATAWLVLAIDPAQPVGPLEMQPRMAAGYALAFLFVIVPALSFRQARKARRRVHGALRAGDTSEASPRTSLTLSPKVEPRQASWTRAIR